MRKERTGSNLIERIKTDHVFRTFAASFLSFFATVAFMSYNVYLGIAYQTAWNISIAVYYALLTVIRAVVVFSEIKYYKTKVSDEKQEAKRKKLFFGQSVMLFVTDVALIAPIALMVLQRKNVDYTSIPAITIAAYTCYKIIISIRNYLKSKNEANLSVKSLRNINLVDALVSVLSLQYTLIMTFGNGIDGDMFALCAVSSFAIWALLIVISLFSLVNAAKLVKLDGNTKTGPDNR